MGFASDNVNDGPSRVTNITNGAEERTKGTIARDPEVVAIVKITGLIDGLGDASRERVLYYLADKYNIGGSAE